MHYNTEQQQPYTIRVLINGHCHVGGIRYIIWLSKYSAETRNPLYKFCECCGNCCVHALVVCYVKMFNRQPASTRCQTPSPFVASVLNAPHIMFMIHSYTNNIQSAIQWHQLDQLNARSEKLTIFQIAARVIITILPVHNSINRRHNKTISVVFFSASDNNQPQPPPSTTSQKASTAMSELKRLFPKRMFRAIERSELKQQNIRARTRVDCIPLSQPMNKH